MDDVTCGRKAAVDCPTSVDDSTTSALQKIHLQTPPHHGDTLEVPPLDEISSLWQRNLERIQSQDVEIGNTSLQKLRAMARSEVLGIAANYCRQYGDFDSVCGELAPIVMAGHQPSLFHPGVWFKNFALSNLGRRLQATSLNLLVDNDLATDSAVRVPRLIDGKATTHSVAFDAPAATLPFEQRRILDWEVFREFGAHAAAEIRPFVTQPLVNRLWPLVCDAAHALQQSRSQTARVGHSIAAGRHRLEAEIGLNTLEVPLSQVAESKAFAVFTHHVFSNIARFREIHNSCLLEYRQLYRIRSRSHPVPELEQVDQWQETPFWVWSTERPNRRRLFLKSSDDRYLLSDLEGWQQEFDHQNAVSHLQELGATGIKIRSRALMTTMFCRLLVCDLFIHGIGGAKYDQLTDLLASRFFGMELPEYAAVSATLRLPTGASQASSQDLQETRQMLRELRYHPEKHVEVTRHPEAERLISTKARWIESGDLCQRKQRHEAIVECNQQLQPYVESLRHELERQLKKLPDEIRKNRILCSRDYSFCLFPETLIEELKAML